MLSSFINAAICSQRSLPAAVAFTLAHRLADVNEEDELTTMFCMFTDALAGVRNSTLADLLAVRTRVRAHRFRGGRLHMNYCSAHAPQRTHCPVPDT